MKRTYPGILLTYNILTRLGDDSRQVIVTALAENSLVQDDQLLHALRYYIADLRDMAIIHERDWVRPVTSRGGIEKWL